MAADGLGSSSPAQSKLYVEGRGSASEEQPRNRIGLPEETAGLKVLCKCTQEPWKKIKELVLGEDSNLQEC